jgi:hypothetical protein
MDRIALVKLIDDQAARLTPEGRDLAQRMELLTEVPPGARSQRKRRNASKRTKRGTSRHVSGTSLSGC